MQDFRQTAIEILKELNKPDRDASAIHRILGVIRRATGFEAVGIRLRKGHDYPYYETAGFPQHFVQTERSLCECDEAGNVACDTDGRPILACMCGNVLRGNTDPGLSFFSSSGSFWTNGTTELLASSDEDDLQGPTRNRCNGEGFESVALIPLRSDGEIIGLLQLNDRREGMFDEETIAFFEDIGASIGVAFTRMQAEENLTNRSKELKDVVNMMAGREIRMAELKEEIDALRQQIEDAGMVPVAGERLR